jgi:glycosyltransferase involved in cell wall biosynthesis
LKLALFTSQFPGKVSTFFARDVRGLLVVGAFVGPAPLERYVSGDLAQRLSTLGYPVLVTSRSSSKLWRVCDMLSTAVRLRTKYRLALVDVFSGPAFIWAEAVCSALRGLKKPYVLTLHGGNLPEFAKRWPGRVRRLLGSAKIVTAPSGYLKEKMEHYCPGIWVLPNAIDLSLYPYRERGPARPELVWLRAFHEIYNPVMAIKVVRELALKYPAVQLTMVGPDKGDGSLQRTQRAVAEAGLGDRVRFLGSVPKSEVPAVLSRADIFLNTTHIDNTPVSVIEAMACGLCVVTTNVGGIPFLVEDGESGLLVERGDASSMAAAVSRYLQDQQFAQHCSRNARRTVEPMDWSKVLAEWDRLFRSVLQETI